MDPANTSTVRQAAASLKEARLIHTNSTELFKQGVVSNVDYERAGVALETTDEQITSNKSDLQQEKEDDNLEAYRDFINSLDVLDEFGKD